MFSTLLDIANMNDEDLLTSSESELENNISVLKALDKTDFENEKRNEDFVKIRNSTILRLTDILNEVKSKKKSNDDPFFLSQLELISKTYSIDIEDLISISKNWNEQQKAKLIQYLHNSDKKQMIVYLNSLGLIYDEGTHSENLYLSALQSVVTMFSDYFSDFKNLFEPEEKMNYLANYSDYVINGWSFSERLKDAYINRNKDNDSVYRKQLRNILINYDIVGIEIDYYL
jgi:hypothetical protein